MIKFTPRPIHGQGSFAPIEINKVKLSDVTIYFNNDIELKVELPNYIHNGELEKELQREFSIMWRNFVMTARPTYDSKRLKKKLMELLE